MSSAAQERGGRVARIQYLVDEFGDRLRGRRILDVGADECHLKTFLPPDTSYWGVGKGGNPDQVLDLESGRLPFDAGAFDVVVCLEVLEHLEQIHVIFDECCRVAGQCVVLSLPNPLATLWHRLTRYGEWGDGQLMKYYGLPSEPPPDRHRWFFDAPEAERFVAARAARNGWNVSEWRHERIPDPSGTLRARLRRWMGRRLPQVGDADARLQVLRVWAVLAPVPDDAGAP